MDIYSALDAEKLRATKHLIRIAALAVTTLAASAHAGEVIRSASATTAELTQYWSQHNSHGLRAVNTTLPVDVSLEKRT